MSSGPDLRLLPRGFSNTSLNCIYPVCNNGFLARLSKADNVDPLMLCQRANINSKATAIMTQSEMSSIMHIGPMSATAPHELSESSCSMVYLD